MGNENLVQSMVEMEQKVWIASKANLTMIAQLIPYLQQREYTAKRYLNSTNNKDKDVLLELLERTNKEIKIIMGL